jgi:hypothetical protein
MTLEFFEKYKNEISKFLESKVNKNVYVSEEIKNDNNLYTFYHFDINYSSSQLGSVYIVGKYKNYRRSDLISLLFSDVELIENSNISLFNEIKDFINSNE